MSELADKVAIVTGAAQGIGKATATALSWKGAQVAIVDLNIELAGQTATQLSEDTGNRVIALQGDISDPAQCNLFIQTIEEKLGGLDILVNNASYFVTSKVVDTTPYQLKRSFEVNLFGYFYCAQSFARRLIAQDKAGVIVNMSSIASRCAEPDLVAYGATKAAVNGLTRGLAVTLAEHNIRVNAVAPGYTATEGVLTAGDRELVDLEAIRRQIPMSRLAEMTDIADVVVMLCTDQTRFVTGQVIFADGGFSVNAY